MTREERKTEAKKAYAALMKVYPFTLENLDGEQWADIAGYEGRYQVSTFGRVKSLHGRWGETKIIKPLVDEHGYLNVALRKLGKMEKRFISRLVAQVFIPNPDNFPEVDHCWGMKFDNSINNLRWVTSSENKQSALRLGLRPSGSDHYGAKLTNKQVIYVRENPDNLKAIQLAKKFGVCIATIYCVQRGLKYKNAGGVVRGKKTVSEDVRKKIRAEYQRGIRGCGCEALAEKYGIGATTVRYIVNE